MGLEYLNYKTEREKKRKRKKNHVTRLWCRRGFGREPGILLLYWLLDTRQERHNAGLRFGPEYPFTTIDMFAFYFLFFSFWASAFTIFSSRPWDALAWPMWIVYVYYLNELFAQSVSSVLLSLYICSVTDALPLHLSIPFFLWFISVIQVRMGRNGQPNPNLQLVWNIYFRPFSAMRVYCQSGAS